MLPPNINEIVLIQYCDWKDTNAIYRLLSEVDSIDVLYGDGRALEYCIKNNDLNGMELLLDHSVKSGVAKDKLMSVLSPLISTWASPVMRKLIARHLDDENISQTIVLNGVKYMLIEMD